MSNKFQSGKKSQPGKKPITVIHVSLIALVLAVVGGIYGFFTGGLVNMALRFIESFIIGFIIIYIIARLHRITAEVGTYSFPKKPIKMGN